MNSEIERIKALLEIDLLDTEPEKMFDDITDIASKVCNMPMATISLIDKDRQFFKSRVGVAESETPIEHSICKVAIETKDDVFIVEDARLDDRFKNFPQVKDDKTIVSYYGVPLYSKSGVAFGSLCVIDKEVTILSDAQKDILIKLANHVEYLIELRIKTKLLSEYHDKVARYSKDMEDFAYLAAHDLKAPVRAINSFTKLLDKKHENFWDEKDKKYIDFIHQSSTKMNTLINDLLEFSKTNMDRNNLESFDLKKLVEEIFSSVADKNGELKPVLICDNLPVVSNSKISFTILFNNLINNALKYQKPNTAAVIEIQHIEHLTHWIFTVKDNGIGIEEEYFEQIFKPFKRLHTNLEYQGTGLGLAACSKIVDHLGGSISVASDINKGSIFTIKIPKHKIS